MGLTNFILTCEKDNEELRKDIKYYKNYNNRLKNNSQQKDKAIDECIELVNTLELGELENGKIYYLKDDKVGKQLLEKLQQAKDVKGNEKAKDKIKDLQQRIDKAINYLSETTIDLRSIYRYRNCLWSILQGKEVSKDVKD